MKNPLRHIIKLVDRWAAQKVVRVALFGHGLAASEWESLMTTPYLRAQPRIQLVDHPSEADVLAIHGPLNSMNWTSLVEWVESARPSASLLAVGLEIELTDGGHVVGPQGCVSTFRVHSHLPGHPPTPNDLQQAVTCVVAHV
jgi:Ni,Fe-hydrogenase III small subunit